MNGHEAKLLSQWAQHHSGGMTIFVLYRGIVWFMVPYLVGFWLLGFFVFHNHTTDWLEMVISAVIALAVGVFEGAFIWRKMERLYGDLQKQSGHLA
jgi:hypothetical protein